MTALRPERGAEEPMSYDDTGAFRAVVEQLDDPLNDPLPGRPPAAPAYTPPPEPQRAYEPEPVYEPEPDAGNGGSPWFRPAGAGPQPSHAAEPEPAPEPARFDSTVPMEVLPEAPAAPEAPDVGVTDPEPYAVPQAEPVPPPGDGGRAARRKAAAQRGGGHRAKGRTPSTPAGTTGAASTAQPAAAPLSRVEARRAAKAAKDSPAVVLSRIVGELFITLGLVMLLFVTYQLWWTNVRAHQQANAASNNLEHQWATTSQDPNRAPGVFSPGQGFAIMYIPKLDVKAPIAQGVSKPKVLDHGMIGHYDGQPMNTAMPWDKTGNFAVAAHRNTHGEPFRYINHLVPGDKIVVETAATYYTYVVTSTLPSTPPTDTDVLKPVPPGSGFTEPGRYITLTTCTPEFQSTNRLIVWGKLIEARPRSKGKPDALLHD